LTGGARYKKLYGMVAATLDFGRSLVATLYLLSRVATLYSLSRYPSRYIVEVASVMPSKGISCPQQ